MTYKRRQAPGAPPGGAAPAGAQFITSATDPTLTAERVLTNTATVTWDFTTPGQALATAVTVATGSISNEAVYFNGSGAAISKLMALRATVVANQVSRAIASTVATARQTIGLAKEAVAVGTGNSGLVVTSGQITGTTAEWDAVTSQVGGLTIGSTYYVSTFSGGLITPTNVAVAGQAAQPIGVAMSTTVMEVRIESPDLMIEGSDVTGSRLLDTTYTNNTGRSLDVMVTVRCAVTTALGRATIQGRSDTAAPPTVPASGLVGIQSGLLNEDNTHQLMFTVGAGKNYSVTTNVLNGTATLGSWFEAAR